MHTPGLAAQIKGSGSSPELLDRFGNRFFRVTEADTILLITARDIYEFPVDGFDSLYVVFRNATRIEGFISRDGGNELINIGYGTVSKRSNTSAVSVLDMEGSYAFPDIRSYIESKVSGITFSDKGEAIIRGGGSFSDGMEALVVLDGIAMDSFAMANSTISPVEVASISVLKDAASTAVYGVRGANGVILITTKRGGDK